VPDSPWPNGGFPQGGGILGQESSSGRPSGPALAPPWGVRLPAWVIHPPEARERRGARQEAVLLRVRPPGRPGTSLSRARDRGPTRPRALGRSQHRPCRPDASPPAKRWVLVARKSARCEAERSRLFTVVRDFYSCPGPGHPGSISSTVRPRRRPPGRPAVGPSANSPTRPERRSRAVYGRPWLSLSIRGR
jgi:hypothetical protein